MFELNIIIGDSDKVYLEQLSKYLMLSKNYHFSIHAFSNAKPLSTHVKNNKTDLLFLTEDMYRSIQSIDRQGVLVLLVDTKVDTEFINLPMVYKYQKASCLEENLMKAYFKHCQRESVNLKNDQCKVIGVYSPIGGVGTTTISLNLAKKYAKENYRTLFLSLEDVGYFQASSSDNMSMLIYYLKKKTKNLNVKLESIVQIDEDSGLRYIEAPTFPEEMEAFQEEEGETFIKYILEFGWYERLIIDFSSAYSKRNKAILALCDHIILLNNRESNNRNKVCQIYKQMKEEEQLLDKLILVDNDNRSMCVSESNEFPSSFIIPFIKETEYENGLKVLNSYMEQLMMRVGKAYG